MNILERMMKRQNEVNISAKGELWSKQGFDWRLAISQETAELIDSFDWKWWKDMKIDVDNAKIEIVDIWHFTLSIMIEDKMVIDDMLISRFEALTKTGEVSIESDKDEIIKHFKNINKMAVNDRPALEIADATLMAAGKIGMSFSDIAKLYMGKAVLNTFRQLHGYADGSYIKVWDGVEDNEVMSEMLAITPYDDSFEDSLTQLLTERYMLVE